MRTVFLVAILLLLSLTARGEDPQTILDGSRIQGGFCVVLGVGDGSLAAGLADKRPFVVHGLAADAAKVEAARKLIASRNLYGKASVEQWAESTLPYADNLVSLLVLNEAGGVPEAEMLRVLRPYGELFRREGASWKRTVKPWPEGMDEWTHVRHGPDGNPVSKDRLVDVPERVQWIFGREVVSERTFAVYSNGRMFAFERDSVVARDAFNGMALWEKRAKTSINEELRRLGYENIGLIVADGERVYFSTPDGKFKAHDAASEKLIMTYEDAGTPLMILCVKDGSSEWGTLVLGEQNSVRALDAKSGKVLWKETASLVKHLVASPEAVYYVCGDFMKKEKVAVVARELKSGKVLWEKSDFKEPCPWPERAVGCALGYGKLAYQLKVPYRWEGGWRKYYEQNPGEKEKERATGGIIVLSAKTGDVVLGTSPGGASARHGEWNDACWVNGSLLKTAFAKTFGSAIYMYPEANLKSEPVVFDDNDVGDRGFGHCYPPTVTERFYINGQFNFVDLKTHAHKSNQITRGGCHTYRPGYLPANGMLYVHPKHCVCFPMLDGISAVAPPYATKPPEETRLVKGPAWGTTPTPADEAKEWPTYRHDADRSSGTAVDVPGPVKVLWTADVKGPDYADPVMKEWLEHQYLPGKITQPTVAGGRVYVAHPDTHRVIAIDVNGGKPAWEFTANGRIDTPPTIHAGLCIFGSRSGWLYCLRASDRQMVYMLRLAPYDRRISMYGQPESPTPVAGSVIIVNGLAYAAAGLHPQADGGVRVFCVEPATGKVVWQNKYVTLGYEDRTWGDRTLPANEDPWRRTGIKEYEPFDLPVRDGDSVAVSRWLFDLKTGQPTLKKTSSFYQIKESGVYMRRRAWSFAPRREDFRTPLAAALGASVFSDTHANPRLFRTDFKSGKAFDPNWLKPGATGDEDQATGTQPTSVSHLIKQGMVWKLEGGKDKRDWARAMAIAGNTVFVINNAGVLEAFSTEDGKKRYDLKVGPVIWDGLAAAGGRLYASLEDGRVICLGQ